MKVAFRHIVAACLVVLIFLGVFQVFFPLAIENLSAPTDQASWLALAKSAWAYFQPGAAVNAQTGLEGAGIGWPYFTEWDLGTYIQAVINAERLGLIQNDGPWGFNYRIGLILNFLETRQLTSNGLPYLAYDWNGKPYGDAATFCVDEGSLYMALYDLEVFRPDLAANITSIINRSNNTALLPDPASLSSSTDFYVYYVACAFKDLGFSGYADVPSEILNTIVSQPTVSAYGVQLPMAHICCEPLLLTFFEVNPQDSRYTWLLSQVNLAQEARYEATGHFTAFSEGNTGLNDPSYVYEFVVDSNGSTFEVVPPITPIIFLKVAVGFYAIFESEYTRSMVNYVLGCLPASSNGFQEGVDENGRVVGNMIDRTNSLILAAAWYAISNMPSPSPSPSPTSTPVVTPTPTATPSPSPTPTLAPSPSLSASSSTSPTSSPSQSPSPSSHSPSPPIVTSSPLPSPSSSVSPSPSLSSPPLQGPTPSSSPFPSPSPSASPIPTTNWLNEPRLIAAAVVITCLFLVLPLRFLLKRNHSKGKQR